MNKRFLRLPMQFFAAESEPKATETLEQAGAENGGGDPKVSPAGTEPAGKTFTQEEVDKIVADRLARQAKQSEKKFTQKEVDTLVAEKISEAEKLAKMNAEQKQKYAQEKLEKELAEREAAINKRELTATAKDILASKGLPTELADIVDTTDADKCTASIESIEKAFASAVQKAVNERLKADPPKVGSANTGKTEVTSLSGALREVYKNNS